MFVAVAGLEPAPLDSSMSFSTARCSTMLNYTAYHVYLFLHASYGQPQPLQYIPSALLDLPVRYRCFVHYVAIVSQPFSLQFSQLPSDLHYYLSVFCMSL